MSMLFAKPDIRQQSAEEIAEHLEGVRMRRMTVVMNFKEKEKAKFSNIEQKLQDQWTKRKARAEKAIEKADEAVQSAQRALDNLTETHNNLSTVENNLQGL